jgi:hypothetical protein
MFQHCDSQSFTTCTAALGVNPTTPVVSNADSIEAVNGQLWYNMHPEPSPARAPFSQTFGTDALFINEPVVARHHATGVHVIECASEQQQWNFRDVINGSQPGRSGLPSRNKKGRAAGT